MSTAHDTPPPSPRPPRSSPALTPAERKAVKALMVDSGYDRASAVAWVKAFGTGVL
jgi:hypothetical protein